MDVQLVAKYRTSRATTGAALLQTVLVFPVLLFLVFGVIEFGQFFYIRHAFQAAARDVARGASLDTAKSIDPQALAIATLSQANVTFNSAWMTIVDCSDSNSSVTDVSTIPIGHTILVTITVPYNQIPNVFRPLSNMTGVGVGATRACVGQSWALKD